MSIDKNLNQKRHRILIENETGSKQIVDCAHTSPMHSTYVSSWLDTGQATLVFAFSLNKILCENEKWAIKWASTVEKG